MTYDQYLDVQTKLLENVPPEFHLALSSMAYESGHAYGYREVLLHLQELIDELRAPLKEYAERIQRESCSNENC